MSGNKKDSRNIARLAALVGTLLFHGLILLVLLLTWLFPSTPVWPPQPKADTDSAEILLGSEYVKIGDVDVLADDASANTPATSSSEQADQPALPGHSTITQGPEGDVAPTVSIQRPSEVKATVRPRPETAGSSKPSAEALAKERAAQEAEAKRNSRTNFSRDKNSDAPKGNTGSPDGNADHGASAGTPGFYLAGRTLASWSKPTGAAVGTITINVTVDRQGRVIRATYGKGSGAVASSSEARQSCIRAALASQFSVAPDDAPDTQKGTITYRFR